MNYRCMYIVTIARILKVVLFVKPSQVAKLSACKSYRLDTQGLKITTLKEQHMCTFS